MLDSRYTYLFGASLFLIPWAFIYLFRKDLRKPLLTVSLLGMFFGLPFQYFWWTRDWWRPLTITGTRVGIEDLVLGFGSAGVATFYYITVSGKAAESTRMNSLRFFGVIVLFSVSVGVFGLFFLAGMHSFVSTVTVLTGMSVFLFLKIGSKYWIPASLSGLMLMVLTIPVFLAMLWVTPGYIGETWYLTKLSGFLPLGIPVEDLVFYFLSGAACFLLYHYLYAPNDRSL